MSAVLHHLLDAEDCLGYALLQHPAENPPHWSVHSNLLLMWGGSLHGCGTSLPFGSGDTPSARERDRVWPGQPGTPKIKLAPKVAALLVDAIQR
jgi:hypothetical protein